MAIINNGNISGGNCSDISKIILLLEKEPDITARKMSEQTGLNARKNSHIMRELRESKVIILIGVSRKGYWEINKVKL